MIRYTRLFLYFCRFSLSRAMEFRLDLFFRTVMDLVFYAVNILFFKVLFLHAEAIGGWDENQMLIFISGYLFLDAIAMTFIQSNLWWLPYFINRGDLDYYLVRPVSSLFFLSFRMIEVNSIINLFCVLGIFGYALWQYPGDITAAGVVQYLLWLLVGFYLYYLLRILFILPVFWTQASRGFETVLWSFSKFMERPDRIFTGWVRRIIVTILPFALMVSFPTRLFLEGFHWQLFGHMALVTGVLSVVTLGLWRKGLKNYSSASS